MPLPLRALHRYTSPTKEVQQALKLFLKIPPCIHKKELAGNANTIQSSSLNKSSIHINLKSAEECKDCDESNLVGEICCTAVQR